MKYFTNFIRNVFNDNGNEYMTFKDAVSTVILFSLCGTILGGIFYLLGYILDVNDQRVGSINIFMLCFLCGTIGGLAISLIGYSVYRKK